MHSNKEHIKAAWLFPDTLYLHGDRGNILTLADLSEKMGMKLDLEKIGLGDSLNVADYDIIYAPPGELKRAPSVIEELKPLKGDLISFIEDGNIFLSTGTTISYFGNKITRTDETLDGLGLIGIDSTERESVYGDDLFFESEYNDRFFPLYGNQIQMIDIDINDETPFGKIHYGYGNNGDTRDEGIIKKNSIFTNSLGPFLTLNPWLAAEMIEVVRQNHGLERADTDLDFEIERKSLQSKLNYTKKKKTELKNTLN